ncbi:hypothetical protein GCM10028814_15100 [Angustibacter aerolatus]
MHRPAPDTAPAHGGAPSRAAAARRRRIVVREAVHFLTLVVLLAIGARERPTAAVGLGLLLTTYRLAWLGREWRRAGAT